MKSISLIFCAMAVVSLSGCSNDSASPQELEQRDGFNYFGMMQNYADNVLIPAYQEANASALELVTGLQNYCSAIPQAVDNSAKLTAQNQWLEAMKDWQSVELMWVGPLLSDDKALRNRIYSYATPSRANTCAIDANTNQHRTVAFNISTASNSETGFDALEYLLFSTDLNHTCSDTYAPTQGWNDLSAQDRELARCEMALEVASDVAQQTQYLANEWAADGGNYRSLFLNPNNAGEFLSQLSGGIFYIEEEVKDAKLGLPFALVTNCALQACPATAEMRYAKVGADMIVTNLEALKTTFNGDTGLGFDDIISFEGFPEVATELNASIEAAYHFAMELASSVVLEDSAKSQLDNSGKSQCQMESQQADVNVKSYCTLHGLVKRITDQLRTDFVTIVNVDLPQRSQSDND